MLTSQGVAEQIVSSMKIWPDVRIIDLGCGDGAFLLAAGDKILQTFPGLGVDGVARCLTGVDIDPSRVRTTRQRLCERFGQPSSGWDVREADALDVTGTFDAVIGNPPWIRLHHMSTEYRLTVRARFVSASGMFDLSFPLVEQGLRLLPDGGVLRMVVPRGIAVQPSAAPLRKILDAMSHWSIAPLARESFESRAGVDPGVLTAVKCWGSAPQHEPVPSRVGRLGSIADVRSCVATGADSVFLLTSPEVTAEGIELKALRRVLRGRGISSDDSGLKAEWIIWPYESDTGTWRLRDMSQFSGTFSHLLRHKVALLERRRFDHRLSEANWYSFITTGPCVPEGTAWFAISDIFKEGRAVELTGTGTVALNTCFAIIPRPGREAEVRTVLSSAEFWQHLRGRSRRLGEGFFRTSVSELRAMPLTDLQNSIA